MAEAEESDAVGINIALEFSKKIQEELATSSKSNESRPTPRAAMTMDTTASATSTAQEVLTYGGHAYYKDEHSMYTMNTL